MSNKFDRAVEVVLRHEGGFVDNVKDAGGATNFGISLRYARTLGSLLDLDGDGDVDKDDIILITKDKAKVVYRGWFWRDVRGDELPPGIDLTVFDYAVNSGAGRAIKALQDAVGVEADGVFGPATMRAVQATDATEVINKINDGRLEFLKRAKNTKTGALLWPTYGRGWTRRVNDVRERSLEMVGNSQTSARDVVQTDTAKAAGAMAGAGGVGLVVAQAAPAIEALGKAGPWVAGALIVAALIGVLIWRMRRP